LVKIFGNFTPAGTISGRTRQPLVLTAPAPKKNKLGSEIQCKIEAPEGYVFVYADLDSQEQRTFGLLGDAQYGEVGATPSTYMSLVGDKDKGTDPHTLLAKSAGISRAQAKNSNYALQFGAGVKKLARMLYAGSKEKTLAEWEKVAKKIIESKKGKKSWGNPMLRGGIESDNFNAITLRTQQEVQREPMLERAITTALRQPIVGEDHATSRGNFNIQGCGASVLHSWLTYIHYFAKRYDIEIESCWSVHDAVFLCVRRSDEKTAAYIIMHAHKLVYTHLCKQLGFNALPAVLAYPSSVLTSSVWLKDIDYSTATPTYKGYEGYKKEYKHQDLVKVAIALETRCRLGHYSNTVKE